VTVFETITERKKAETALRENEERLRLSLHAANQGLYDLNVQTGDTIVNREYAEMLGYDPDSFIETNAAWIERLHPDDRELIANAYANYIKGLTPEYRVEFRQKTKDDSWKWILSLGKVIEYDPAGKPLRMLGTHTDITERKQAEAKLRSSEEQYRLMFTNNPLPMFVFDRATFAFLAVNDATVAHYGYSHAEFMKMTIKDIRPPDDIPAMISAVAIKSEPYFNTGIWKHCKKDGTLIDVEITRHTIMFDGREAFIVLINDVTERKRAEEALKKAHDELELQVQLRTQALSQTTTLLETMLEYTPDQIYFKDADSRFIRNSKAQALALGLSDSSQVVGKTDFDFFPHAQRSYEEEQEIIRSGKPLVDFEEWVVWPNGQEIWVSTTKVPLRDQTGQIIGTFGISRNITERKRNEAALLKAKEELEFKVAERTTELRETNEQLQRELSERKQAEAQIEYQAHLLENVSEAIIATDEKQMITSWNSGAENLYGWDAAEVIGKPARQIIHSEFSELQRAEAVKALTETGDFKTEVVQYHRNGQMFWAEGHTISVRDETGKVTGFVAINRDVTDRKQAEDELRRSKENFAKAFISNPAAIAITRLADGKFININPAYTRIMEYETNELLGRTAAEMNIYVHSEERDQIIRQLGEQGNIRNYELHVRTKTGDTRSIVISMEPIIYNEEECILTVFIDISERQKMETELRRSNDELEQFAYVASHDLQEPLRAVAGMVQLLGQRYQGKLDERADEYIGHAVEASTRMQKLINDLLDYSRVNRLGRSFESTAVERSLNNALANLQLAIQESQAQITHDPLPTLMTDSGQLTQVLQNLIGNAIKFRGERPLHIHIGAKKIEQAWQFEVSDNGIGIESKYYERIFLVFQRLHTRREYPGTGIGLALCKKIIERHGGQIWVESQPGLGSTFYFTIPERQP
jgi:PAS domain S-box-containing protein